MKNYEASSTEKWFSISCIGDISKELSDFKITFVKLYNEQKKLKGTMSNNLVPFIKSEQFDDIASEILTYLGYAQNITEPVPLNVYEFASRAGLSVINKAITKDLSVFGELLLEDAQLEFYDTENDMFFHEKVGSRTIVCDGRALVEFNKGNVNNTIVHETIHWVLHRKSFYLRKLFDTETKKIRCQFSDNIKEEGVVDKKWMEWQANSITPRILMPKDAFIKKADEIIAKLMYEKGTFLLVDVIQDVIDELACFFEVSKLSAKLRMIETDYDVAMSAYIYSDGKYVHPHAFKKGAIQRNQTYTLGAQDAAINILTNNEIHEAFLTGKLKYVESHICINNSKYIKKDRKGNDILTKYARLNMHECCLVFDIFLRDGKNYKTTYETLCVLCRELGSSIKYETKFSREGSKEIIDNINDMAAVFQEDIFDIYKQLSPNFNVALKQLRNWKKYTQEELAEKALLSDKTIRRLEKSDDETPTLETVIAIIIALEIPPMLATKFISLAGHNLQSTKPKLMAYNFLIQYCTGKSIHECNEMLRLSFGLPPLTDKQ